MTMPRTPMPDTWAAGPGPTVPGGIGKCGKKGTASWQGQGFGQGYARRARC